MGLAWLPWLHRALRPRHAARAVAGPEEPAKLEQVHAYEHEARPVRLGADGRVARAGGQVRAAERVENRTHDNRVLHDLGARDKALHRHERVWRKIVRVLHRVHGGIEQRGHVKERRRADPAHNIDGDRRGGSGVVPQVQPDRLAPAARMSAVSNHSRTLLSYHAQG